MPETLRPGGQFLLKAQRRITQMFCDAIVVLFATLQRKYGQIQQGRMDDGNAANLGGAFLGFEAFSIDSQ